MSYQLIEANPQAGKIKHLCRALGVSPSGYYAWRERQPSQRQRDDDDLLNLIRRSYSNGRSVYGSPRIHADLKRQGVTCSRKRVARLMREAGLRSLRRTKQRKITTDSRHLYPIAANLLQRDFSADKPNQKWLVDLLAVSTAEGWLYLAAVLDTYSRQIVGWAMHTTRDEQLVSDALAMALVRRHIRFAPELIHHSDRGSQYAANGYRAILAQHAIQVSMSGKADPYDNAMMESFFSTLRAELTDLVVFSTRHAARTAIFEFIEVFYNRQRLHSSLGYLSPVAFEAST